MIELSSPSTSTVPSAPQNKPQCAVCSTKNAIYTCPRCHIKTCSLSCSSSHKTQSNCSGQRNKVAFVPMNGYKWGTMMDDYVYLEEVGRNVSQWGKEIGQAGYHKSDPSSSGFGRGRGRGRGRGGRAGAMSKRDIFQSELERRGIDMDVLAVGMSRRKINQSTWDTKNDKGYLTIEYKIHPPSTLPSEDPFVHISHRNDMSRTPMQLLQHTVGHISQKPAWLRTVVPDSEAPNPQAVPFIMFMRTSLGSFHKLQADAPLIDDLKGMCFVEFPVIEVWSLDSTLPFTSDNSHPLLSLQRIPAPASILSASNQRPAKRRKLNHTMSVLGGYGSDEDEKDVASLVILGAYSDSEVDEASEDTMDDDANSSENDANREDAELSRRADPQLLLNLLQSAGDDVDTLDWGEDSDGR